MNYQNVRVKSRQAERENTIQVTQNSLKPCRLILGIITIHDLIAITTIIFIAIYSVLIASVAL